MQKTRQEWLPRAEMKARIELRWLNTTDQPMPEDRQMGNWLGSGLGPVRRGVEGRLEYEAGRWVQVAEVLARSASRERMIIATPEGPWAELWRLNRTYSENGVVELANTAFVERETQVPRRTLLRDLEQGELPGSRVGNTWFVPVKALPGWVQRKSASGQVLGPALVAQPVWEPGLPPLRLAISSDPYVLVWRW